MINKKISSVMVLSGLTLCAFMVAYENNPTESFSFEKEEVKYTNTTAFSGITQISVNALKNANAYADTIDYASLINNDVVTVSEPQFAEVEIPSIISYKGGTYYYSGFKSYMDYKTITNHSSIQWQIQESCYTDEQGFRRFSYNNTECYVVAVGNGIGVNVGDYIEIVLEDGNVIPCIVGDIKSDLHTDTTNKVTCVNGKNPCASEFIVDETCLNYDVLNSGDSSKVIGSGKITCIRVFDE